MEQPYSETNAGLHYDLQLTIDPPAKFLAVSGNIAYHSPKNRLERARFYLHRQLNIQSLSGRRVLGYHYDVSPQTQDIFISPTNTLDIYFDPPLEDSETALIQIEYSGRLTEWPAESSNIISTGWSELGSQLPWFPCQYDGSFQNFTFTLRVDCPAEYRVASFGKAIFQDGTWFISWPHQTSDIVVAVSRSLNTIQFESGLNRVILSSSNLPEKAANQLGEDLLWILERYSGWFGPTRPSEFSLIESPRIFGGGYTRRGLAVLSGLNERDYFKHRASYLSDLGHGIAHSWWWEADTNTWEDWLNEGLAEYSTLLAIRERFGADVFENFLDNKRKRIPEALPIWGFDRLNIAAPENMAAVERLLYDRGPLILHNLAQRLGNSRFLELCRAVLWSKATNTPHLLDLLEELEGSAVREWMETQLRKGSIP